MTPLVQGSTLQSHTTSNPVEIGGKSDVSFRVYVYDRGYVDGMVVSVFRLLDMGMMWFVFCCGNLMVVGW